MGPNESCEKKSLLMISFNINRIAIYPPVMAELSRLIACRGRDGRRDGVPECPSSGRKGAVRPVGRITRGGPCRSPAHRIAVASAGVPTSGDRIDTARSAPVDSPFPGFAPSRVSGGSMPERVLYDETHISAQQSQTQTASRFSGTDGHQGGTADPQRATCKGTHPALRLSAALPIGGSGRSAGYVGGEISRRPSPAASG